MHRLIGDPEFMAQRDVRLVAYRKVLSFPNLYTAFLTQQDELLRVPPRKAKKRADAQYAEDQKKKSSVENALEAKPSFCTL